MNYTYDNIGQLKSAQGWESDGVTPRLQEQFGYAYDKAWNLNQRTNDALVQSFGVNTLNEPTNVTRSGTFTVAGTATEGSSSYSKHAEVTVPSLDDWEKEWEKNPQRNVPPKLLPVDFRSPLVGIERESSVH